MAVDPKLRDLCDRYEAAIRARDQLAHLLLTERDEARAALRRITQCYPDDATTASVMRSIAARAVAMTCPPLGEDVSCGEPADLASRLERMREGLRVLRCDMSEHPIDDPYVDAAVRDEWVQRIDALRRTSAQEECSAPQFPEPEQCVCGLWSSGLVDGVCADCRDLTRTKEDHRG